MYLKHRLSVCLSRSSAARSDVQCGAGAPSGGKTSSCCVTTTAQPCSGEFNHNTTVLLIVKTTFSLQPTVSFLYSKIPQIGIKKLQEVPNTVCNWVYTNIWSPKGPRGPLNTPYSHRNTTASFILFLSVLSEGLYWSYEALRKMKVFPSKTKMWNLACDITSCFYLLDKQTDRHFGTIWTASLNM